MAVAVDAASSANNGASSVSSLTWSHTVSGGDRLLVVGVSYWDGTSVGVTGVTYAGVAMTSAGSRTAADGSELSVWYLVAPALGANNVVVTFDLAANGVAAGALSLNNVHQTSPLGTFVTSIGNSTGPSVNATGLQDGIVVDVLATGPAATASVGAGQTQRWNLYGGSTTILGAGSSEAGTGSITMSWTLSVSQAWAIGALPLRGTVGGGQMMMRSGG